MRAGYVLGAQKFAWHGVDYGCTARRKPKLSRFTACSLGMKSYEAGMSSGIQCEEYPKMAYDMITVGQTAEQRW